MEQQKCKRSERTKYERLEVYKALLDKKFKYRHKHIKTIKATSNSNYLREENRSQIGRILKINQIKTPALPIIKGNSRIINPTAFMDEK